MIKPCFFYLINRSNEQSTEEPLHEPPVFQNIVVQHMEITEPLTTLRELLEARLSCNLSEHEFYLQDSLLLDPSKNLVEQCVQGEGMVQINVEVKSQPGIKHAALSMVTLSCLTQLC